MKIRWQKHLGATLFLLVVLTGCLSVWDRVLAAAPIVSLTPASQTITTGDTASISWTISGAATCTASDSTGWSSPWQTTSSTSPFSVAPTSSVTYYLECWDTAGVSSGKKSAVVNVGPTLTLSPASKTITLGESVTLIWSSSGDTCVLGDGTNSLGSQSGTGSTVVTPTATTTYVMTCYAGGTSSPTRKAAITVNPTTACSGNVTWLTNCGASISTPLPSGQTQAYDNTKAGFTGSATFGCNNTVFTAPSNATCTPSAPAPQITKFTADKTQIGWPTTVMFTWEVTNATTCTLSGGGMTPSPLPVGPNTVTVSVTNTATYTLVCSNASGVSSAPKSVTVTLVVGAPQVSLSETLNQTTLPAGGGDIVLGLQVSAADNCVKSGYSGPEWQGNLVPLNGSQNDYTSIHLSATTTFVIECFNNTASTKKSLTITVSDAGSGGGGSGGGGGSAGGGGDGACLSPNICQPGCQPGRHEVAGSCGGSTSTCCGLDAPASNGTGYFNPLQFDSFEGVFSALLGQLRNIIVILAIIVIIIGALLYITSAGNESRLNTAKAAITAALIGLALAIAAPSFLKEIASILGWTTVTDAQVAGAQSFTEIASKVLDFLLSIVGIIAIIMLVIGGFMYLTAAGDEGKAETGKKIVTYATIAIAVALSALVLVTQVAKFFS